jgi:adenine-specific DNA-methyltransferase
VSTFENTGLVQLIVELGAGAIGKLPEGIRKDPEAVAETIAVAVVQALAHPVFRHRLVLNYRAESEGVRPLDIVTRLLDPVEVRAGRNVARFRLEGEWRYTQATLDRCLASGDLVTISRAPFRPNHVRAGGAPKKLKNLLSAAHYPVGTFEDATEESRALFGAAAFDYPKPESLLSLLISAVTARGDLVLDPFAGSGTTGAAAHKLGRRWVMIESGPQCDTHILPRMRRVVEGRDAGGITAAAGWEGGGGFRYLVAS